jgi:hypothetical protein
VGRSKGKYLNDRMYAVTPRAIFRTYVFSPKEHFYSPVHFES